MHLCIFSNLSLIVADFPRPVWNFIYLFIYFKLQAVKFRCPQTQLATYWPLDGNVASCVLQLVQKKSHSHLVGETERKTK